MTFPNRIVSAAIHYFRVHPDLWRDRLARLAAMGVNTVETYVAWNFHSSAPGVYDFTGWRDISRFMALAGELGLKVIVRPGPYICAEWEFGGFPAWLMRVPGLQLRCSNKPYLAAVDEYFDALMPHLIPQLETNGGPVIAIQVENEYGSWGDDHAYLEYLRDGLINRGVTVPLFTSDGAGPDWLASGTLPGVLATGNFGSRAAEAFGELEAFRPGEPKFCMEFWHGWFDHWGEHHHTRDPQEAASVLDDMLRAGGSVNFFMGHGGTNFGLWSGCNFDKVLQPTVTSYDYDAPVGEGGEITEKFFAFRAVIGKYFDLPAVTPPAEPARLAPQTVNINKWATWRASEPAWGEPVTAATPLTMEEVGSGRGLILYRSWALIPPDGRQLILDGLHDRAYVFVDGELLGVLDADQGVIAHAGGNTGVQASGNLQAAQGTPQAEVETSLQLPPNPNGTRSLIEVLVENRGRINFGPQMGLDRKGVRAIRIAHRHVYGWESIPVDLDDAEFASRVPLVAGPKPTQDGPMFAAATVSIPAAADGFIALPGWGRGFVWLNGFLLGRYDAAGPQRTLYAPAPLWRGGENNLLILEMSTCGDRIEIKDTPDLG